MLQNFEQRQKLNIYPNTPKSYIGQNGTKEQKMLFLYFDENGNITYRQTSSHNSPSLKNGKSYIEDSSTIYCGSGFGGGTGFCNTYGAGKGF